MLFVLLWENGEYQITDWGLNDPASLDYIFLLGDVEAVIRYLLGRGVVAKRVVTCLKDAHEGVEIRYLDERKAS